MMIDVVQINLELVFNNKVKYQVRQNNSNVIQLTCYCFYMYKEIFIAILCCAAGEYYPEHKLLKGILNCL